MEDVNVWVVIGLGLDAVGAIGVLLPDLPRARRWFSGRVPLFRSIRAAEDRLLTSRREESPTGQEASDIRQLWPLLQEEIPHLSNQDHVVGAEWVTAMGHQRTGEVGTRVLRVYGRNEELLNDLAASELQRAVRKFVERQMRRWGAGLLIIGFLLQLGGQLAG